MAPSRTERSGNDFRVALLGYGTIGGALHRVLEQHRQHIQDATGRQVKVTVALVRDASRPRFAPPPPDGNGGWQTALVEDPDEIFASEPDLVCEALGGLEPARSLLVRALERGIPCVTANKQLIAHHGTELFGVAERYDTQLRFEASVCGAIPIVRMLRESLVASRIDAVQGILNGTTNYILSAMASHGTGYDEALADAQRLGYAEPDPSDDVEGRDAAAKLAILAGLAFHARAPIDAVRVAGITEVSSPDVHHADALGYVIKLIGRAQRTAETMFLDVGPMLVPLQHPLASVAGATNAVLVKGAPFGELALQGAGAGGPETASALAGDIVGVMGSQASFLTRDPQSAELAVGDAEQIEDRFYVRLLVPDRPGVLAGVAGALAGENVSIERVVQQRGPGSQATLVLVTHPTTSAAMHRALDTAEAADRTIMPILEGAS